MREAAAVVFPSIWFEGMPLTLLEALACGTPVVASRLGGIPEIILDDVCGVLFEAGNSDALATSVRQLWHDPPRRARLAAEARANYARFYSSASNYTRLLDIYQQVIRNGASLQRA
jgi:glycosyltransferase involved in cell wall biosynthesis